MKLKYKGNFLHPRYDKINDLNRISAIAYAPTDNKVAIVNVQEKIVHVLDVSLMKQDKIPTKSVAGPDTKMVDEYYVTDMEFNGDRTKLAVAQSDGGVFVYKIGQEFKEKKSIVNKFIESSKIMQILYVDEYTLIFVTAAGDLKIGNLRSNKSSTIVSASSTSFGSIVHADNFGELVVFLFEDGTFGKYDLSTNDLQINLNTCSNAVIILAGIGSTVLIGTSDGKVQCYDIKSGNQKYAVINSAGVYFKHAHKSSSGNFMVFASKNELTLISFDSKQGMYSELDRVELNGEESNNYILSRVCMNPSGNQILLGSAFGHLDLLEVGGRKVIYNDVYEIDYHGSDQATVGKSGKILLTIKSKAALPITRIIIKNDRFVVAETSKSLIIADFTDINQEQIEVDFNWANDQNDTRYYFHVDGVCIVRVLEDIKIINLVPFKGAHTVNTIKPCRFKKDSVSVRMTQNALFAAFMVSKGSIRIVNLHANVVLKEINVSNSVNFISLSNDCEHLLYIDEERRLMLVDLKNAGSTRVLLEDCSFTTWLSDSNKSLVAQSRNVLTIWYNIDADLHQNIEIKGNVVEVKPVKGSGGSTCVVVSNTNSDENYEIELERPLFDFSMQLDGGDLKSALISLESAHQSKANENMMQSWLMLANSALDKNELDVVQRCFAELGYDILTKELESIQELKDDNEREVRLALYKKQYKISEKLLIVQRKAKDALATAAEDQKQGGGNTRAKSSNLNINEKLFEALHNRGIIEEAALLKAKEGNIKEAVKLLMSGKFPVSAFKLIERQNLIKNSSYSNEVAAISEMLQNFENYSVLAELQLRQGLLEDALASLIKCKNFPKALELVRKNFPERENIIQEQFGDYLSNEKHDDENAINRYLDALKIEKALALARTGKSYKRLGEILQEYYISRKSFNSSDVVKFVDYFTELIEYYSKQKSWDKCEYYYKLLMFHVNKERYETELIQFFIRNGQYKKAMEVNNDKGMKILMEACKALLMQPTSAESLKKAEGIYCIIQNHDAAIEMYKDREQYDDMMRLVRKFYGSSPDIIDKTVDLVGRLMEERKMYREAERFFMQNSNGSSGSGLKKVINMYVSHKMFSEAIRVGRTYSGNGNTVVSQILYLWIRNVLVHESNRIEDANNILSRHNIGFESIIHIAIEKNDEQLILMLVAHPANTLGISENLFKEAAMKVARSISSDPAKGMLAGEIFEKFNMYDDIIAMHLEKKDFKQAEKIANQLLEKDNELGCKTMLRIGFEMYKEFQDPKAYDYLFIRAGGVDLLVQQLMRDSRRDEALRLAKEHSPKLYEELSATLNSDDVKRLEMISVPSSQNMYAGSKNSKKLDTNQLKQHVDELLRSRKIEDWNNAIQLASIPSNKLNQDAIIKSVANNYASIQKYLEAGKLYASILDYKLAMECYVNAGLIDDAKQIADTKDSSLKKHFQDLTNAKKSQEEDAKNSKAQILLSCKLDNFDLIVNLIKDMDYPADVLNQFWGNFFKNMFTPPSAETFFTKDNSMINEKLSKFLEDAHGIMAKKIFKLWSNYPNLWLLHLLATREKAKALLKSKSNGSSASTVVELLIKQTLALFSYAASIIPIDRIMYEVGYFSKSNNYDLNLTFLSWNKMLDIVETIDEQPDKNGQMEFSIAFSTEFNLGSVSRDKLLFQKMPSIDSDVTEAVRDHVLTLSLENRSMTVNATVSSLSKIFPRSYSIKQGECCIVSGMKITDSDLSLTECKSCKQKAIKEYWNCFVQSSKSCPVCYADETPKYM